MLIFIFIIGLFSCSSNKPLVVEQIDSNYPIILVKGKDVNKITTVKIPLVFRLSKSFVGNTIKVGSLSYWHNSQLSKKNSWMAGCVLYTSKNGNLQLVNSLKEIDIVKNEFVIYTRHSTSYNIDDEIGRFFQSYYNYMVENHKDTLHIESIQQLKKENSNLAKVFLQGDSLLFRIYCNEKLIPYTCPVLVK